ncbi:hypothetical protein Tco_1421120 [Tanacetum coccineum]
MAVSSAVMKYSEYKKGKGYTQPNYHKWEKFISFKLDIPETPLYKSKPMISKQYKKETDIKVGNIFDNKEALELEIRLKALDEGYQFLSERSAPKRCDTLKGSIQGNKSNSCRHGWKQSDCANFFWYMQRGNRHAAIALAVHNEFPLAFDAICCRHLMMNLSLKRKKMKGLFWKIYKAYTPEEFSTETPNLQDVQPDAYHKICKAGPERWSSAHCPLVRYNYMTSNSVESVNACTVLYRKLPVLKLAEMYHAMVQEWYFKRRELAGMKAIKNDYNTNVMYDIAKVARKLQLFVSHYQIDLSTVLIPNDGSLEESFAANYNLEIYIDHLGVDFIIAKYIFPNASLAEMMNHVITNYTSESKDDKREVTQNDYTFNQMVEWAEQKHFEDEETKEVQRQHLKNHRRPEINRLNSLPDHPLIEYGRYALGCMTGADMKKATYLKMVRDELLMSMEEKR